MIAHSPRADAGYPPGVESRNFGAPAGVGPAVDESAPRPQAFLDRRLVWSLSAVKLALHLSLANRYGYFRDELYFLDCGRHLDWGYVDHAPLIGLLARIALWLGGSLFVLRGLAGLAGAGLVALTMLIAWRLGGDRFAQGLAGLAVLVVPGYLGGDGLFTMNGFERLLWTAAVYTLIRILQTRDPRLWLLFGVLLGLGLMNKHSTVFFGFALLCGLLLTPDRRLLQSPGPWLAAGLALLLFLPNLLWQVHHDFPTLEDLRNVSRIGKNVVLGPVDFVAQQILLMHPLLAPLWLAGLVALWRGHERRYRALAWTFLVFFVTMFAMKGKNYYLAPMYPMLFAAGAVALESGLARWRPTAGRAWPRAALVVVVAAGGLLIAPLALPLLSPERYVAYESALGITPPKTEVRHSGPLPQHFADQFGWQELTADVARVYQALPFEERSHAAIFANNYGEAGAINLFGPRYGLPAALCPHQTHFYWGTQGFRGDVLIVLQREKAELETACASVEEAGAHAHPWGMPMENTPIFVCRGLKTPLDVLWPKLKRWD
jgi:hypothetical protein